MSSTKSAIFFHGLFIAILAILFIAIPAFGQGGIDESMTMGDTEEAYSPAEEVTELPEIPDEAPDPMNRESWEKQEVDTMTGIRDKQSKFGKDTVITDEVSGKYHVSVIFGPGFGIYRDRSRFGNIGLEFGSIANIFIDAQSGGGTILNFGVKFMLQFPILKRVSLYPALSLGPSFWLFDNATSLTALIRPAIGVGFQIMDNLLIRVEPFAMDIFPGYYTLDVGGTRTTVLRYNVLMAVGYSW